MPAVAAAHLETCAGGKLHDDGQPDAQAHEPLRRALLGQLACRLCEAHDGGQHCGVEQVLDQILQRGARQGGKPSSRMPPLQAWRTGRDSKLHRHTRPNMAPRDSWDQVPYALLLLGPPHHPSWRPLRTW